MEKSERFWIRVTPRWRERVRRLAEDTEATEAEATRRAVDDAYERRFGTEERVA